MKIIEFERIIAMAWSIDTCEEKYKDIWTSEKPYIGQNDISSLIVNDFFGGKIIKLDDSDHYYNTMNKVDGEYLIDITYELFNGNIPYYKGKEVSREELLSKDNTKERYLLLLKNLKYCFEKYGNKTYKLLNKDGFYESKIPGMYGGSKKQKIYGKMDCPSALKYIEKGKYIDNRVFFANEEDALKAGYRPCSVCMREEYKKYKSNKLILKPGRFI